MTVTRNISNLSRGIGELLEQRFTGEIVISQRESRVSIYLSKEKLLWVQDKRHFRRRWHRALNKHCAEHQSTQALALLKELDDYQQLSQAVARQQIEQNQVQAAIAEVATECLFELFIQQSIAQKLMWTIEQNDRLEDTANLGLSAEETKAIVLQADLASKQWQSADLGDYLPSLSPVVEQEQMYDAIEMPIPKSYLQGQHTLWDIAAKMQTSIILIARSLVNLEKQKIIRFQQIPDLPETSNGKTFTSLLPSQPKSRDDASLTSTNPDHNRVVANQGTNPAKPNFDPRKPIIACIDDSPVLAHSVKKILASVGYQSMIISEPMAGMGLLAKYRPNLILLDLLMPTVNGYSVCKFLRETSLFKTTPIIILTSKDTIVDRTRAKLAGATDFLTKPPEPQELLQVIRLHLIDIPWG
ncbi:MAG: response regulator [Hyellaceae cyanobacterium CSU_1_1]|nr:response regulator [Hyellaceae cyanobacterium CSU_1_1]